MAVFYWRFFAKVMLNFLDLMTFLDWLILNDIFSFNQQRLWQMNRLKCRQRWIMIWHLLLTLFTFFNNWRLFVKIIVVDKWIQRNIWLFIVARTKRLCTLYHFLSKICLCCVLAKIWRSYGYFDVLIRLKTSLKGWIKSISNIIL